MICRPVPEVESVKLDNSLFGKAIFFFIYKTTKYRPKILKWSIKINYQIKCKLLFLNFTWKSFKCAKSLQRFIFKKYNQII